MKGFIKRFSIFMRNNRIWVIFSAVRAVLLITAVIALVLFVRNTFFAMQLASSEMQASQEAALTAEETQEAEGAEEAEEEIVVAAETGAMDDADDPEVVAEEDGAEVNLSFENDYETSGVTYGIDVSKYQGTIDWAKVASAGVEFAMIRVGYRTQSTGVIYEDPCAKYNLQEAQKNGIKTGAYFFSTAVSEAEVLEEAAWTTGFIAKYRITYPVAFNCEGFSSEGSRQYSLSSAERTVLADKFLGYVQKKGYTPMFYASKSELADEAEWDTGKLESKYKIWVSQYPGMAFQPGDESAYAGTHAMWQHTNKGTVAGISKNVDLNVAYFGFLQEAEAKDSSAPEEVSANPEVGINFTAVNETVTSKMETNLRSVPSSASQDTIVSTLKNGDTAVRTGVGSNGWSRLSYNGQTVYAVSSYLTTDLSYQSASTASTGGVIYEEVNEEVTAKSVTNLRSRPGSDYADTIVGTLKNGETAVRTGIGSNGWSRLSYNGQTVYAVTSYLTTDLSIDSDSSGNNAPADNGGTSTDAGSTEMKTKFTDVNENVTAKSLANLRSLPGATTDDTIVGQLNNGEIAVRTGISDNGWSRLSYNGQTVYAVTSYLMKAE